MEVSTSSEVGDDFFTLSVDDVQVVNLLSFYFCVLDN